jgi:uncharacterized membrane protein HdeD (DUF308 family)
MVALPIWGGEEESVAMLAVKLIIFVIIALAGAVFALQGANILTDSPVMSGRPVWTYIGIALVLVGLAGVIWSFRGRRA